MKKLWLLFLISCSYASAQVSYQQIDSITNAIREIQRYSEGMEIMTSDGAATVSYPEDNFNIMTHSRLGYQAYYLDYGNKELLKITEKIDLSKVNGVGYSYDEKVAVLTLFFPAGVIEIQTLENGVPVQASNKNTVQFVIKKEKAYLYFNLIDACYLFQVEKKMIEKKEVEKMKSDFLVLNKNDFSELSAMETFCRSYPNSLYMNVVNDAMLRLKNKLDEEKKVYNWYVDYIDSLKDYYKFQLDLSESEYRKLNTEADQQIGIKNYAWVSSDSYSYSLTGKKYCTTTGPVYVGFKNNNIRYLYHNISVGKGNNTAPLAEYNKLVQYLKEHLTEEYYEIVLDDAQTKRIVLQHPERRTSVTFQYEVSNIYPGNLSTFTIFFRDTDD